MRRVSDPVLRVPARRRRKRGHLIVGNFITSLAGMTKTA
jgi:hypothetical protein